MQVQTVAMYQARVTDEGGASGVLSPVLLQRCNWESTTLVHQAQSSLHHFTWPLMLYISTSLSHQFGFRLDIDMALLSCPLIPTGHPLFLGCGPS
jgi:hypothetical protein